jgi:hypothetical protein
MKCDGKFGEGYPLFAIGVLEDPERQEIQSHLDLGCETCLESLRNATDFWTTYAVATVPEDAAPSEALRGLVVKENVVKENSPARVLAMPSRTNGPVLPYWKQAVAAGLVLSVGGGLGWWSGHSGFTQQPQPVAKVGAPLTAPGIPSNHEIEKLQAQLRELNGRLSAALAKPNTAASQALASLQGELARTQALYTEATDRLARAQGDLQQNRTLLAAAQQDRQSAEDRLRATLDDRNKAVADRDRLAERERKLTAQNRDLETQIVQYKAVLDQQSNKSAPLLRLAAMLNSPSVRLLHLKGAAGHADISGNALIEEGAGVVVYAAGLPPLPKGRTYQLWLIRRQGPGVVSGGVFTPDTNGRAMIQVSSSALTAGVNTVAVTDEPAGGSPLPTGARFLIGIA